MHSLRLVVLLTLLSVGAVGTVATPVRGDDDRRGRRENWFNNSWYGARNTPYYWQNWNTRGYSAYPTYSPYRAYSPYSIWGNNRGGYYSGYRYYNSARTYPWGWYY